MNTDTPSGWKLPEKVEKIQATIMLFGIKLANGPRPVVEVRNEMKLAGYGKKLVNEAVRFLQVRERQVTRPGPVCFVMPGEKVGDVAQWAIDLLVGALK